MTLLPLAQPVTYYWPCQFSCAFLRNHKDEPIFNINFKINLQFAESWLDVESRSKFLIYTLYKANHLAYMQIIVTKLFIA